MAKKIKADPIHLGTLDLGDAECPSQVECYFVSLGTQVNTKDWKGLSKVGIHTLVAGLDVLQFRNVFVGAIEDAQKDSFPSIYLYGLPGDKKRAEWHFKQIWHDVDAEKHGEATVEIPSNVIHIDFKNRKVA